MFLHSRHYALVPCLDRRDRVDISALLAELAVRLPTFCVADLGNQLSGRIGVLVVLWRVIR